MATELPTIAEILASKEVLSPPRATNTVVKVGEKFVVKYGGQVSAVEARNLSYVRANSDVPVPRVFGMLEEPEPGRKFLIMEFAPGKDLLSIMDELTSDERQQVCQKVRDALLSLRSMPPIGYIGALDREPCQDGIFYTGEQVDPSISGPFPTEKAMNQGILKHLGLRVPAAYHKLLSDMVDSIMADHTICFTHADLQPKNIMVDRRPMGEDGKTDIAITIIDWEYSGWYPDYWEFCNANYAARKRPQWLEMMRTILPTPLPEYMLIEIFRSIIFY